MEGCRYNRGLTIGSNQPLHPFSDIDPLLSNSSFIDEIPIPAIDEIKLACYERTDDLDEDEWIHPNYNDEDDRNILMYLMSRILKPVLHLIPCVMFFHF